MNSAHCLYIVLVIGKHTDIFRRIFIVGGSGGEGYVGGSFHGVFFNRGRGFSMKGVPDFLALF